MKYVAVVLAIAIALLLAALVFIPGPEGAGDNVEKGRGSDPASIEPIADLQIIDLKVGDGDEAKDGYRIAVHYTGRFLDGRQFDSSVGKSPYSFRLGRQEVIAGWDKGLVGMKVGGKRKLVIPYRLAYGEEGGNGIPPKADLKFEVELLQVQR